MALYLILFGRVKGASLFYGLDENLACQNLAVNVYESAHQKRLVVPSEGPKELFLKGCQPAGKKNDLSFS